MKSKFPGGRPLNELAGGLPENRDQNPLLNLGGGLQGMVSIFSEKAKSGKPLWTKLKTVVGGHRGKKGVSGGKRGALICNSPGWFLPKKPPGRGEKEEKAKWFVRDKKCRKGGRRLTHHKSAVRKKNTPSKLRFVGKEKGIGVCFMSLPKGGL